MSCAYAHPPTSKLCRYPAAATVFSRPGDERGRNIVPIACSLLDRIGWRQALAGLVKHHAGQQAVAEAAKYQVLPLDACGCYENLSGAISWLTFFAGGAADVGRSRSDWRRELAESTICSQRKPRSFRCSSQPAGSRGVRRVWAVSCGG